MKTFFALLTALLCSFELKAFSNFIANPYTPYPPGCATLPDLHTPLYGDNIAKVFDGEFQLQDANKHANLPQAPGLPVNLVVYRVACAEENRSIVLLEFSIPDRLDPFSTYYRVPRVGVTYYIDGWDFNSWGDMRLVRDPNSWAATESAGSYEVFGGNTPGTTDGHTRKWVFALDNAIPAAADEAGGPVSPTTYNEDIWLEIETEKPRGFRAVTVKSTSNLLTANPRIPLTGRLSGNWVVDGASDQGMVMSISEPVPDAVPAHDELMNSSLLMFLSWFTFDQNGDQLWLTGAAQFEIGATEVTVPIEVVSKGEFLGSKTAERTTIGSVTIIGNSCNDLTFRYDLDMYGIGTGLGAGTEHLHRLFSLETAGYVCRDLEARMLTK